MTGGPWTGEPTVEAEPADDAELATAHMRAFAVYSGKYRGRRTVYEDTGGWANRVPIVDDSPLFAALAEHLEIPGGISVYIRHYDDGTVTYLGPREAFLRLPAAARPVWDAFIAGLGAAI